MKDWLKSIRLRDALMLVALPLLVLVLVFGSAMQEYLQRVQFNDWWSREARLRKFVVGRMDLAGLFRSQQIERNLDAEAADPRLLRLRVEPGPWEIWQNKSLGLKDDWIEADLQRGPVLSKVEIKKRGDTSVHWTTPKKSFSLKTPRGSLYKGYRRLAYSSKDVLPQVVTARLAEDFDLLAPYATVAPVFLNDRFYGVYRVIETIEESFLRRERRMPGNVFRGDTAMRGEYFKGLPRGHFINPYIWDRTAVSNKPGDLPWRTLQAFLTDLNRDDFDGHLALMNWLDRDEVARLLALMLLVGDPYHMDDVHNQNWYLDPSSGLMHPIPWDLRLWELDVNESKRPFPLNRFLEESTRNPWLIDAMWQELAERTADGRIQETVERLLRDLHAPYSEHFRFDQLRVGTIAEVGSPEEVRSVFDANLARIGQWLTDAEFVAHLEPGTRVDVLDVESRGFAGADLQALVVEGLPPGEFRLRADRNLNGVLDDADPALAGVVSGSSGSLRIALDAPEPLLASLDGEALTIRPAPLHYRFFVEHQAGSGARRATLELTNRRSGLPVEAGEWAAGSAVAPTPSWHPWQYPAPPAGTIRLEGDRRLVETLRVESGHTLRIAAGTTLRLAAGVSILSYGKVLAEGTADRPIRIEPEQPQRPWGALVLQGDGADGSRFEHVTVRGGSGARLDRVAYSGMVSVHWADDVSFRNVTLAANVGCDDTFNAVHSTVELLDCAVLEANSDAIDFDYSGGRIEGCRIERPANDAIDLMTSDPWIVGNELVGAGDKGISVGEASRPMIFGNSITGGNRGLEIKDLSEPWIVHNTISGNEIGILQNVKNWRYGGGGLGKLIRSTVRDNGRDLVSDSASSLTVADSMIDQAVRSPGGDELAWIYRMAGLWPDGSQPGRSALARRAEPVRPLVDERYEDDFERVSAGWHAEGGITRLDKREHTLFVSFGRGRGRAVREIDWELPQDESGAQLVFELRSVNVADAAVAAVDDRGVLRQHALTAVPATEPGYGLVTIDLPPGRYRELRIVGAPDVWHEPSRIQVRSMRLVPGTGPAKESER